MFAAATLTLVTGATVHFINDFAAGTDKIEFIGFAFPTPDFIDDDAFTGVAGEVRAVVSGTKTIITMDSDGDLDADYRIDLNGTPALAETDFLFT